MARPPVENPNAGAGRLGPRGRDLGQTGSATVFVDPCADMWRGVSKGSLRVCRGAVFTGELYAASAIDDGVSAGLAADLGEPLADPCRSVPQGRGGRVEPGVRTLDGAACGELDLVVVVEIDGLRG